MEERNIDAMKYRKSTHLAGVDVEAYIGEHGNCVLTIKDAFYGTGVDVNGKKLDGYFLTFFENVKPMCVNSTNRKTIASIVKTVKDCTSQESRNIGNWINQNIELIFDDSVMMKGERTGGIRIKPMNPIRQVSDENAIKILKESTGLETLQSNWSRLTKDEQALPKVAKLKDELKAKYQKNDK